MKKIVTYPLMVVAIPVDFVLWNLFMGWCFGFVSFKKCVADNYKQWGE